MGQDMGFAARVCHAGYDAGPYAQFLTSHHFRGSTHADNLSLKIVQGANLGTGFVTRPVHPLIRAPEIAVRRYKIREQHPRGCAPALVPPQPNSLDSHQVAGFHAHGKPPCGAREEYRLHTHFIHYIYRANY